MRAICIIGSPKSNGSTACITDTIIEGMKANNIEIKRYVLGEMDIKYCKGCQQCYESRKCIQNDDMNVIIKDLIESDIVVIASPSYWGDVTGQLKVFFDRSTPLCDTNGETTIPKGKVGISVAVRTGQRVEENMNLIHAIEHYYGHLGITPIKRFTVEGVQVKEDFQEKAEKVREAFELGLNILKDVESQEVSEIMIGLKDGEARLEPHSRYWEEIAKETINKLKNILGTIAVDIQHVGSTSVVGLMAKPIIDIEVGVNSIQNVIDLIPKLEENGFYYRPRTTREGHVLFACRDFSNLMDTHYIHVVAYGSSEWKNNIKFRDILNENIDIRKEYEELKLKLAKDYSNDRAMYTSLKAEFIQKIMNK